MSEIRAIRVGDFIDHANGTWTIRDWFFEDGLDSSVLADPSELREMARAAGTYVDQRTGCEEKGA